ncbi:unnamed protein product [Meloidogyne enterolobii]
MEASTSNTIQYQTIPNESETGELFEFEALLEIRERDGQRRIASRPNNFRSTSNTTRRLSPSATRRLSPSTIDNNNDGSYIDTEQQGFFMRRDRDKLVLVMLKQTAGPRHLRVKNCFGMLLAPGRNLRQSDM